MIAIAAAAILGTLAAAYPLSLQMAASIEGSGQGATTAEQAQQRKNLNFFLRLNDDQSGITTTKPVAPMASHLPPTETPKAGNNTNLIINATVSQGEKEVNLPVNASIPSGVDDVEFCAAVGNGTEVCQPVLLTIDLTQNTTEQAPSISTSGFTPAALAPVSLLEDSGSLISIDDTTVTIPITVIIPLTVQIQDAQICASVLSSGDVSCTQLVMDPDQTSYTFVDVDLTTDSPTLSSSELATTEQEDTTTSETSDTNSTDTNTTTSDDTTSGSGTTSTDGNTTNSTG
jgi:hypothetical protein